MELFSLTEVSQLGGICHLVTVEMVLSQVVLIVDAIAGIGNQVFNELQAIAVFFTDLGRLASGTFHVPIIQIIPQ